MAYPLSSKRMSFPTRSRRHGRPLATRGRRRRRRLGGNRDLLSLAIHAQCLRRCCRRPSEATQTARTALCTSTRTDDSFSSCSVGRRPVRRSWRISGTHGAGNLAPATALAPTKQRPRATRVTQPLSRECGGRRAIGGRNRRSLCFACGCEDVPRAEPDARDGRIPAAPGAAAMRRPLRKDGATAGDRVRC
jgi:hypothetical protein